MLIKTEFSLILRTQNLIGQQVSHDILLGRWRLCLDLFGRVFCDDVGAEAGSVIHELGGFPVKESRFRREMEKIRNSQQRDLSLEVVAFLLKNIPFQIFIVNLMDCIFPSSVH